MPINFAPSFAEIMNLTNYLQQSRKEREEQAQTLGFARKLIEGLQPQEAELADVIDADNAAPLSPFEMTVPPVAEKPLSAPGQAIRFPGATQITQPDFRSALMGAYFAYPQMLANNPQTLSLLAPPAPPVAESWKPPSGWGPPGTYYFGPSGDLIQVPPKAPKPTPQRSEAPKIDRLYAVEDESGDVIYLPAREAAGRKAAMIPRRQEGEKSAPRDLAAEIDALFGPATPTPPAKGKSREEASYQAWRKKNGLVDSEDLRSYYMERISKSAGSK